MVTNQMSKVKRPSFLRSKLVLGFGGVLAAAVIGSAGVAAAHPMQTTMNLPSKETCATQWQKYHFKNRGQCEAFWNKHKHDHKPDPQPGHGNDHGHGHGYGGNGNTVNTGVNVVVNGNNNVISIVINYFFGH